MFCERTSVGLDVHARSVVAAAIDGRSGEVFPARLTPSHAEVIEWVGKLPGPCAVVYEAGPTGFGLARALSAAGLRCEVAASSKLLRPAGDRVKTDARDALNLARLLRLDEVVPVRIPSAAEEAARDLVRSREAARADLMRARHRLSKLLLRHGIPAGRQRCRRDRARPNRTRRPRPNPWRDSGAATTALRGLVDARPGDLGSCGQMSRSPNYRSPSAHESVSHRAAIMLDTSMVGQGGDSRDKAAAIHSARRRQRLAVGAFQSVGGQPRLTVAVAAGLIVAVIGLRWQINVVHPCGQWPAVRVLGELQLASQLAGSDERFSWLMHRCQVPASPQRLLAPGLLFIFGYWLMCSAILLSGWWRYEAPPLRRASWVLWLPTVTAVANIAEYLLLVRLLYRDSDGQFHLHGDGLLHSTGDHYGFLNWLLLTASWTKWLSAAATLVAVVIAASVWYSRRADPFPPWQPATLSPPSRDARTRLDRGLRLRPGEARTRRAGARWRRTTESRLCRHPTGRHRARRRRRKTYRTRCRSACPGRRPTTAGAAARRYLFERRWDSVIGVLLGRAQRIGSGCRG